MSRITERYSSAVHSKNLNSASQAHLQNAEAQIVDTDVLGAMGLADKALQVPLKGYRPAVPLAVPLERLFAGDNRAAHEIVRILGDMAWRQARGLKVRLTHVESQDMARACLAWHRHGVCKACGGHGYSLIPGTKTLSERNCEQCKGHRTIDFDGQFPDGRRALARWMLVQMTVAASYAGPEAMRRMAGKLQL